MPGLAALSRRHVLSSILAAGLLTSPATTATPALAQAPVEPQATPVAHHPPLSAASGVLIVEARRAPDGAPIPESDAQLQRRIQTHVATIASEHHMRQVVNAEPGDVRRTQWFRESGGDANERAAWLRDHCRVAAVPGTSLIEIALPDVKDADERKAILQAVGTEYIRARSGVTADALKDRTAVLVGLRDKARSRLNMLTTEKQQAQLRLNDGGRERLGALETELSKLVGEQIEAAMRASKSAVKLASVEAAAQQGQALPGEDEYVARNNPYLKNDEQTLQQIEVELSLSREQYGPNHPGVKALEKRLEVMREKYKEKLAAAGARARAAIVEEAKADAAASKARQDALAQRVEKAKDDLGELSTAMRTLLSLNEEERGLREQVKVIQEQIDNVVAGLGSSSGGTDIHWHLLPQTANR